MLPILLIGLIGLALMGVALLTGGGKGKSVNRRIAAFKARHDESAALEVQMRRISSSRASKADAAAHRLLPNPDLLRKRIEQTGRSWTLGQYAGVSGGLTVVTWLLLAVRGTPLLLTLFVGLLVGIGLPYWLLGRMGQKRIARFIARFPDALELVVRGLRSGLPISETIGIVGSEVPEPVGSEFRSVADKMRIGRTMEAALQETADRIGTSELQFFVITLAIQRETGGNLAETLSNLADVLRKRMQMRLKIKAMSSESKASAYIIGVLPFAVFGLITWMNPDYMGAFFTDPRLITAAMGGGVWMGIGVFIMSKMINFEI